MSFYSRKPVIVLPRLRKKQVTDPEKGAAGEGEHAEEDALDQHVEDVLRKRDKFRRVMKGVWSFVKTRASISARLTHSFTHCSFAALGVRSMCAFWRIVADSREVHYCCLWVSCW